MPEFHTPPISPMAIAFDAEKLTLSPEGPTLTRRMSDLEGFSSTPRPGPTHPPATTPWSTRW